VVLAGLLLWLRFREPPEPPPTPRRPKPAERSDLRAMEFSRSVYEAGVRDDAAHYGASTSPAELEGVLSHEIETPSADLAVGGPPLALHRVRLTAKLVTLQPNNSAPLEHVVLRIENLTDVPLAYRVDTRAGRDCLSKVDMLHDAIALPPKGAVERTECVARGRNDVVSVKSVETITLPALSFYYVSRLYPAHVGLDARATRGHSPPQGEICHNIPEQAIRLASERGQATWRDVIDFYARHSCERYMFPVGYRAFTKSGERSLPVAPADVAR
jgi:hypothetical protein